MKISIDKSAGFCWGVVKTIDKVEETLEKSSNEKVYILGEIIHNPNEIKRLEDEGLLTIKATELASVQAQSCKVIIRAHGEPPATYHQAEELGIRLIDATCPLVKALQNRIRKAYEKGWQVVIFGKHDHAEVIGLRGVCNDQCIVVRTVEEAIEKVDLSRKTMLFSQTTMQREMLQKIINALTDKALTIYSEEDLPNQFQFRDTICKYVSGRDDTLKEFAGANDLVLFVAGKSSSNGKMLFNTCKSVNDKTYFIENTEEISFDWFDGAESVGITGATSTPKWYLEEIKDWLEEQLNKKCLNCKN